MRKLAILATGVSLLAGISPGQASDHLFTAVGAGGLTMTSSNPFVKTNGRPADIVPGQGSPLSGADHTTPAVEMGSLLTHHLTEPNTNANPGNGTLKTPPPVTAGKTAPSANSPHMAFFVP